MNVKKHCAACTMLKKPSIPAFFYVLHFCASEMTKATLPRKAPSLYA